MRHFIFLFTVIINLTIIAQDEYLINPLGGGDYTTISAAISDLEANGLSDNVVFYLEGEFTEQMDLTNNITNSDSYEIVFVSVGDPDDAVITYEATSSSDNYLVKIAGGKIITFQNLKFIPKGTTYSRIIYSDNPLGNLNFTGNVFQGNLASINSPNNNLVQLVADNSSEDLSNITFESNEFYGGYNAIYLDSYNSPKSTNLNIQNNNYFESCINGISIIDFNAPTINNNEFTQISSRSIFLLDCENSFSIQNNKLSTLGGVTTTGIEINLSNGTSANRGIIANNFVQSNEYGIKVTASDYINFYFNTINIEDNPISTSNSSYSFFHDVDSDNLNVMNNIFNNYQNGYSLIGHKETTNDIDYNNLFTHGAYLANWNGNEDYTDLPTFQTGSSTNINSYEEQVTFVSRTDLHVQASPISLDGNYISSITEDIDGDIRNNPPFIGADEFDIPITGPLNGYYTVGTSGDFQTITEAVNALYTLNIDGPVIFNILSGTYTEQIILDGSITGSSLTNTITFQSLSGNPNDVEIISNPSSSTDNYVVLMSNVEFIKIKNITLTASNPVYSKVVYFDNINSDIEFIGNILNGNELGTTGTLTTAKAIFHMSSSPNKSIRNSNFTNNTLNNGAYGFYFWGTSTLYPIENIVFNGNSANPLSYAIYVKLGNNIQVLNNTFTSFKNNVIKFEEVDAPIITGNNISYTNDAISNLGDDAIYLETFEDGFTINSNVVNSTQSGISIRFFDGLSSLIGEFYNNSISAGFTGLSVTASHYIDILNNTIHVYKATGPNTNSRALNIWDYNGAGGASDFNIYNNLLYNTGGSGSGASGYYAIRITDLVTNFNSDYNNLFSLHGSVGELYGAARLTLEDFQNAGGTDGNSYSNTVLFVNDTTDLHLAGYSDLLLAPKLSSVATDIDGETRRDPTFVGADEPPPPLSGTYTIGIGGDYSTLTEATDQMKLLGIDGDISFNILDGSYTDQIDLDESILQTNLPNTITFQSNSGNPSDVLISHTASTGDDNFVVRVDSLDNVKIKNLSLTANGTNYSRVVQLISKTNNLELSGNILSGTNPDNSFYDGTIILARENSNLDNSVISNNVINNGFYGIWMSSPEGELTENLDISGNTMTNNRLSLSLRYLDSPTINDNEIFGGRVSFSYIYNSFTMEQNDIYTDASFTVSGITFSDVLCNVNSKGRIVNNFIQSSGDGLRFTACENLEIFFNSIQNYEGTDSDASFELSGVDNDGITIQNNILQNKASGYAFDFGDGTNIISDYNNLFTNGDFIGKVGTQEIATFEDYKIQTGTETNSYNENVTFTSATDLHISAVGTPLLGTQISGITTDIDGDTRSNPPFIGADEPSFQTSTLTLNIFLEGPYNSGTDNMNSTLTVPTTSPFTEYPKTVNDVAANVVDWVLVKLVDENDQPNVIAGQSAFLLEDGSIVSADDLTPLEFTVTPASYFVVVEHRNHLSVMSASAIVF